ncbi:MAG: hypothetical protein FLDDKLPJ_00326 [Phycisphaerae bacterium]|nr:hypothetical protein [Phycisphaerae bacterium]
MQLPVHDPKDADRRSTEDVRALAIAVQANLAQLRTTAGRRPNLAPHLRGIDVPSPGAVRAFRDALLTPDQLRDASDPELLLRLHETWGHYCTFCWAYEIESRGPGLNFAAIPPDTPLHCDTALHAKEAEVHALLWRLRHELRRRGVPVPSDARAIEGADDAPATPELVENLARRIPAEALGTPVSDAADSDLLLAACQHAGMLAVLRWLRRPGIRWGDEVLTRVAELPF